MDFFALVIGYGRGGGQVGGVRRRGKKMFSQLLPAGAMLRSYQVEGQRQSTGGSSGG